MEMITQIAQIFIGHFLEWGVRLGESRLDEYAKPLKHFILQLNEKEKENKPQRYQVEGRLGKSRKCGNEVNRLESHESLR